MLSYEFRIINTHINTRRVLGLNKLKIILNTPFNNTYNFVVSIKYPVSRVFVYLCFLFDVNRCKNNFKKSIQ